MKRVNTDTKSNSNPCGTDTLSNLLFGPLTETPRKTKYLQPKRSESVIRNYVVSSLVYDFWLFNQIGHEHQIPPEVVRFTFLNFVCHSSINRIQSLLFTL